MVMPMLKAFLESPLACVGYSPKPDSYIKKALCQTLVFVGHQKSTMMILINPFHLLILAEGQRYGPVGDTRTHYQWSTGLAR